MATTVYLLLGSNLGDRAKNLAGALERLHAVEGLEITATSSVYVSQAQDLEGEHPSFLNQVVQGDYDYLPNELLNELEMIERQLGRTGKGEKRPRSLDLDILLFGHEIVETERLSIPHRELLRRPFAMVPLLEIDPGLVHPATRRPIAEFLDVDDRKEVVLYQDHVARHI